MTFLGSVSSEGGPLLLVGSGSLFGWRGADGDGDDFRRTCAVDSPGGAVTVGEPQGRAGVVWDLDGAGTADLFRDDAGGLLLLRAWLDADDSGETATLLALANMPPAAPTRFGRVRIESAEGLAVLWAAEGGAGGEMPPPTDPPPALRELDGLEMGGSGVVVALPHGEYDCFHDAVEIGEASAIRCHLIRVSSREAEDALVGLISEVRVRPGMYLGDAALTPLYFYMTGFLHALYKAGLPYTNDLLGDFQEFVNERYPISTSQSWRAILIFVAGNEREGYRLFCQTWDDFLAHRGGGGAGEKGA